METPYSISNGISPKIHVEFMLLLKLSEIKLIVIFFTGYDFSQRDVKREQSLFKCNVDGKIEIFLSFFS